MVQFVHFRKGNNLVHYCHLTMNCLEQGSGIIVGDTLQEIWKWAFRQSGWSVVGLRRNNESDRIGQRVSDPVQVKRLDAEGIEGRIFTDLATNPVFSTRDFRTVPEKYRALIPEYVKDYVSLNQFAV